MDSFQQAFGLLLGGIALTIGLISLFIGVHKDGEKTDLFFGLLCMLMFLFFIMPPQGFVMAPSGPYPRNIIIKRIFNFSFYMTFPWFVLNYTGYKKKLLPILILILGLLLYLIMALTKAERNPVPFWSDVAVAYIGLIVLHGFIGVRYQFKHGRKKNAKAFQWAMYIFLIIFIMLVASKIDNDLYLKIFHTRVFFGNNIFPIAFIVIMGIRLRSNSLQKSQLEQTLQVKSRQWESHLNNMQLIVVHVDNLGNVLQINPYGVSQLQCKQASDIISRNWNKTFMTGPKHYINVEHTQTGTDGLADNSIHKNAMITRDGSHKMITWSREPFFDDRGILAGIRWIGADNTEQEMALQQVRDLKLQLETENLTLIQDPDDNIMDHNIIGKSQAITYAIQKAKKVAGSQVGVLLEGETGVGKELFADLIQKNSLRNSEPFIKVNCGALPPELVEDELFGHEKGAFTGAGQPRKGRFEMADKGTIFLDEIGELPLNLQPKLLRVLQNGEFEKVGGQQTIKVDVRILAATNRDLENEVREGRFREDLFYRLNVFPITIPPLRSRKEDIPLLIQFYIDKKSKKHNKSFKKINKADMESLIEHEWPGNIRELENVIERSVISSDEKHSLKLDWGYSKLKNIPLAESTLSLEQMEREHILTILNQCHWRISGPQGAAGKLDMNPSTLRSKMIKLKITPLTDI